MDNVVLVDADKFADVVLDTVEPPVDNMELLPYDWECE